MPPRPPDPPSARRHPRRKKTFSGPKPGFSYPTDQELGQEVQAYLDQLSLLCRPEQITNSPPGFAGVFLEPIRMEFKARRGQGSAHYKNTTLEYSGYHERTKAFVAARQVFCKGLAINPTTRALALLALSRFSVKMMERGLAPSALFNPHMPSDYNRHHIAQKSARPLDGRPMNHLSNLVLINTGATGEWRSDPNRKSYNPILDPKHPQYDPDRAQRPELNAHHFFHGALLLPQTETSTKTPPQSTVYCPRPAFPIFPPLAPANSALHSRPEIYARLEELEPGIGKTLPKSFAGWADKLVAFAEACHDRPYRVPKLYHQATLDYTHIYERKSSLSATTKGKTTRELDRTDDRLEGERETRRAKAARAHEITAASFLPLHALVNGKKVSRVLQDEAKKGQPVLHHPIPLVPSGWKPVKSCHQHFPSMDRVRQNMREAGLASRIPESKGPPRADLIEVLSPSSFLGQAIAQLKKSFNLYAKISQGTKKRTLTH